MDQLIHHPEYNSTLILRSETVQEYDHTDDDFPEGIPTLRGLLPFRVIHRKLLPRRPGRDKGLEQYCTLYGDEGSPIPTTLVLTPILPPGESQLPYYHPAVLHLAFRFLVSETQTQTSSLRIEVLPLPDTPTDLSSRLYRTCLALLDTLHRYLWGVQTSYKKRMVHDALVPRDKYQDLPGSLSHYARTTRRVGEYLEGSHRSPETCF